MYSYNVCGILVFVNFEMIRTYPIFGHREGPGRHRTEKWRCFRDKEARLQESGHLQLQHRKQQNCGLLRARREVAREGSGARVRLWARGPASRARRTEKTCREGRSPPKTYVNERSCKLQYPQVFRWDANIQHKYSTVQYIQNDKVLYVQYSLNTV